MKFFSLNKVFEEDMGWRIICDFSYIDCKIGYDDRIVKSIIVMGCYMKCGKD